MAAGIIRAVRAARASVEAIIAGHRVGCTRKETMFARGVSGEGFDGGYRAALDDVLLALRGVEPERWRKWRHR